MTKNGQWTISEGLYLNVTLQVLTSLDLQNIYITDTPTSPRETMLIIGGEIYAFVLNSALATILFSNGVLFSRD